jgi:MFS family permease
MVGSRSGDPGREDRLTPAETRRALLVAALAWGVFGSAWASMVSGAVFVSFVREKLGAPMVMYGLFSSLPFLGVLAQLPGAWWVERFGRRRALFLATNSANRMVWFLVAALPWVIPADHPGARLVVLLGLMMVGSALGHAGTPAFFSWFADMIPERVRGRYLGRRAALATTTAVVVSAAMSHLIDRNDSFPVFTVIFCAAGVVGLVDIELFLLVREPRMAAREKPWRLWSVILEPLGSRPFRGYLLYALSEAFMFGFAGAFFWLMGLEGLKIGKFWSNLYVMVLPMVFTAVALPLWGNVTDRFGSRPLVTLGTLMSVVFPVCWILARPGQYHMLLGAAAVIGGLFGAAIQVGDMNMVFALTPRETRSAYLAVLSLASSLGWAVAPALGAVVARELQSVHVGLWGLRLGNLHFVMLISLALRLLHAALVIPRLPDKQAKSTRALVVYLACCPFRRIAGWFARTEGA